MRETLNSGRTYVSPKANIDIFDAGDVIRTSGENATLEVGKDFTEAGNASANWGNLLGGN